MISDFVKSVIGVAVVVVVIVAVAIPILNDLATEEIVHNNGDTVARYSKYDGTSDITIDITFVSMTINDEVVYEFSGDSRTAFPVIVSKYFVCLALFREESGALTYIMDTEDCGELIGNKGIEITISNGNIKTSSQTFPAEEVMIYDPDGDYGVYPSDGDLNAEHVTIAKEDDLIQICMMLKSESDGDDWAYIRMNDGQVVSSNYVGCTEADYPITMDVSEGDGMYTYGFVSIPSSVSDWYGASRNFALAPIETKAILEPTPTGHMILLIPLIMVAGIVIATVYAFISKYPDFSRSNLRR